MLRIANPSVLRVTIDPDAYLKAAANRQGLWHLLNRLFMGEAIAETELETWGLKVTLEDEFVRIERAR